jgi:single-stranded DNA-binding protein
MLTAEIAIIGKLANAPERRTGRNGELVVALHILVPDLGKRDGQAEAAWCRTTCFGDLAHTAAQFQVGDLLFLLGQPTLDKWRDARGNEKSGLSMTANVAMQLRTILVPPAGIKAHTRARGDESSESPTKAKPAEKPKSRVWHGTRLKFEPRADSQAPLGGPPSLAALDRGDDLDDIFPSSRRQ